MKIDRKMNDLRMNGASWMLEFVKKKGVEAAEKELHRRNVLHVPIEVPQKMLDDVIDDIKTHTYQTMLIMSAMTLRDEYDFGKVRIERFINRFNKKVEAMLEEYITFEDLITVMKEECDIQLQFDWSKE